MVAFYAYEHRRIIWSVARFLCHSWAPSRISSRCVAREMPSHGRQSGDWWETAEAARINGWHRAKKYVPWKARFRFLLLCMIREVEFMIAVRKRDSTWKCDVLNTLRRLISQLRASVMDRRAATLLSLKIRRRFLSSISYNYRRTTFMWSPGRHT